MMSLPSSPSPDRRTAERRAPSVSMWLRAIKPSELLSLMALIAAALALLGYRRESPMQSVNAIDARLIRTEKRVDSLDNRLGFIAYMQCVQLRKNDPASLPPDCAPIIESRRP